MNVHVPPRKPSSRSRSKPANRIRNRGNNRVMQVGARPASAKYDAARQSPDNLTHWALVDSLSADAANNAGVRRVLRNRSRYEVANNSDATGMMLSLSNETVGTGPRLQLLTANSEDNRRVESAFNTWLNSTRAARKLRTARRTKAVDGESFLMMIVNSGISGPVPLDFKLIEADQISHGPSPYDYKTNAVDGIDFDGDGNPKTYHLLPEHPGETSILNITNDPTPISAKSMVHMFREDRPGQHRGIPELTPALMLFADMRRYVLAVVSAAEKAASFSLLIHTDEPDPYGDADTAAGNEEVISYPLDEVDLPQRDIGMVLPFGFKPTQLRAEHPTSECADFMKQMLRQMARCVSMPLIVASGYAGDHNYASGRLDIQAFQRTVQIERHDIQLDVLDRLFELWLSMARLIPGVLPKGVKFKPLIPHQWFWDGIGHADPKKEADAQNVKLKNGSTTLPAEYAKEGKDYEVELTRQADALNITVDELRELIKEKLYGPTAVVEPVPSDEKDEDDEKDEK